MTGNRLLGGNRLAFGVRMAVLLVAIVAMAGPSNLASAQPHAAVAPLGSPVHPLVTTLAAPATPRPAASVPGWVDLTTGLNTNPTGRMLYAAAFDYHDGYDVLFGGDTGSYVNDTWTYQNGTWTELTSLKTAPADRYGAAMTYDPSENGTVLFGGYDGSNYYSDTWVFSGGHWTKLKVTGATPVGRWRFAMAYDAADGYTLLFGGYNAMGYAMSDTWKFSDGVWTNITAMTTNSPPALYRVSMSYDSHDKEVVLFGGTLESGSSSSQTWVYSNYAWTQITKTPAPLARVYDYIGDDPAMGGAIMYGGASTSSGNAFSDTWEFTNGSWINVSSEVGTPPSARGYGTFVWDPYGQYLIASDGSEDGGSIFYAETWAFGLRGAITAWSNPTATDVGGTVNITALVLNDVKTLTYGYGGLPPGCVAQNAPYVSCTVTTPGTYVVDVWVNNTAKETSTLVNTTVVVNADPTVHQIQFAPPKVTIGAHGTITAIVAGGTPYFSYNWTKLPTGCTAANLSTISCAPTKAGTFNVTVGVTDSIGKSATLTAPFTVAPRPTVSSFYASPAEIDYGQSSLLYANVTGGTAPYSYVWTNLPTGACAAANVSPLPCKPAELNLIQISVKVSDVFGFSVKGTVNLTVNQVLRESAAGISSLTADVGTKIAFWLNTTGGTSPYTYNLSGGPPGCGSSTTNPLSCTPTAAGTYTVIETVTDAAGAQLSSTPYTVTVAADPAVAQVTVGPPAAIDLGQPAQITVNVTAGSAPFTFAYTGLPAGCSNSAQGSFQCTPSATGKFPFTVTVTDSVKKTATGSGTLTVNPTLKIASFTVAPGSVNPGNPVTVTVTLASKAGTAPYAFSYTDLPAGCSTVNNATFTCKPTTVGTYTLRVTVSDAAQGVAISTAMLNVTSPSSSSSLSGSELLVIVAVIIVVVVVLALVFILRRRSSSPKPPAPAPEEPAAPAEEAPASEPEELYGQGPPSS
jgi:hypothetical protein